MKNTKLQWNMVEAYSKMTFHRSQFACNLQPTKKKSTVTKIGVIFVVVIVFKFNNKTVKYSCTVFFVHIFTAIYSFLFFIVIFSFIFVIHKTTQSKKKTRNKNS